MMTAHVMNSYSLQSYALMQSLLRKQLSVYPGFKFHILAIQAAEMCVWICSVTVCESSPVLLLLGRC